MESRHTLQAGHGLAEFVLIVALAGTLAAPIAQQLIMTIVSLVGAVVEAW